MTNEKTGLGYTEPMEEAGWVDALCTCRNPSDHAGLYCPNRERAPEEQPNYVPPLPVSPSVAEVEANGDAADAAADAGRTR